MTDDKQLEELAARMRQRIKDEPGTDWDRLSAGELDDDAVAALRRAEADGKTPRGAYDAFRPLDARFRRKLADKAADRLANGRSDTNAPEPIRFPVPGAITTRRRYLAPLATAATVLLALGVVFSILPGGGVEPIPGYSAALTGASAYRSGPQATEVPMFRPGDRFELRLTPDTAVDGQVGVRLYLLAAGSVAELGTPQADIAPSGAVRITGTIDSSVFLPAGEATLYAVVARDGALPAERTLHNALADKPRAAGDGWQAWRLTTSYTP